MTQPLSFDADGVQFAWDATSIENYDKCPRYYYYTNIEGYRPANKSVHLLFGGFYATALEHFYKHLADGMSFEDAQAEIVWEALRSTWLRLEIDGKVRGGPMAFESSEKTRANLIRTIIWYTEFFREDPMNVVHLANGKPAVELSFSLNVDNGVVLCGHLDRVVEYGGAAYVMDQKAQPLTTKVLTPKKGWVKIGDLQIGDFVVGRDGLATEIVGLFPKGITPVYQVHFNDGTHVACGEDHLWTVADQFSSAWKTLELKTILTAKQYVKFHVPLVAPIQHETAELPLHPFVLGVLLGDGYLGGNSIQLSTSHIWLADAVAEHLNGDVIKKSPSDNYVWTISGGKTLKSIRALGLKDKLSAQKFIPEIYLLASEQQRRELLRGLLVTDGSWNGKSRIYDSTSLQLTKDICALVRSLGGTARYRDRKDGAYRVSLRLPELPTGVGKRYITKVVRVADEETCCIKVSAADGLYVTENYTVTHNTTGQSLSQYYFNQWDTSMQMSLYSFAGGAILNAPVKGVVIDAAQIAGGFSRFMRGFTIRTDLQLQEWYDEALHKIEEARHYTREQHFPRRTASCGNYGGCPFRSVCGSDPRVRPNILAGDFVREARWDPIKRR
ncbi:MAG: PD-(D/E)XK nuclease family protein [Dehalococcoidia bacterium]|jgi:hypothetical protein